MNSQRKQRNSQDKDLDRINWYVFIQQVFIEHLLYISGTILSTRDMTVTNSDKILCYPRASNLVKKQNNSQKGEWVKCLEIWRGWAVQFKIR